MCATNERPKRPTFEESLKEWNEVEDYLVSIREKKKPEYLTIEKSQTDKGEKK